MFRRVYRFGAIPCSFLSDWELERLFLKRRSGYARHRAATHLAPKARESSNQLVEITHWRNAMISKGYSIRSI